MQLRLKKLGIFVADKIISFRNTSAKDGTPTPIVYDTETGVIIVHNGAFEKVRINLNAVPMIQYELEPVIELAQ